jgi:peroxidase
MPTSALIPSLFSLFGVGNSDRFSPGFASMRCFIVDKPWDCHPSNALEDLLWKPHPTDLFPHARWVDEFWANELDLPAQGQNLLFRWGDISCLYCDRSHLSLRLITENSGTRCVQKNPLFPYDPNTNPIVSTAISISILL